MAVGLLGRQLSILGDSVAGYHTILSHGMRTLDPLEVLSENMDALCT